MDLMASVHRAIDDHIFPAERKGEATFHQDMWRACVALHPQGPLVLMEFKVIVNTTQTHDTDAQ